MTTAAIEGRHTTLEVPGAAFFSARASTLTVGDWKEAYATWDFGDGTTAQGWEVSHQYATAGTYVVLLTITDRGGNSDSAASSVTATDPVFAVDYYVDPDLGDDSNDGSEESPWASWDKFVSTIGGAWVNGGNHRVNIKRGTTQTVSSTWSMPSTPGKAWIMDYGSEALPKPVIHFPVDAALVFKQTGHRLTVRNVKVTQTYDIVADTGIGSVLFHVLADGSGHDDTQGHLVTLIGVEAANAGNLLICDEFNDRVDNTKHFFRHCEEVFLQGCSATDMKGNVLYIVGEWVGIVGCSFARTRQHVTRTITQHLFIQACNFLDPAYPGSIGLSNGHSLKLHGDSTTDVVTQEVEPIHNLYSNIRESVFRGMQWTVMVAPQDASSDSIQNTGMIERCLFATPTFSPLYHTSRHLTFVAQDWGCRNCFFTAGQTDGVYDSWAGVVVERYASVTTGAPTDILVENNSFYHRGLHSFSMFEANHWSGGTGITNVTLRNNVYHQPNAVQSNDAAIIRMAGGMGPEVFAVCDYNFGIKQQLDYAFVGGVANYATRAAFNAANPTLEANSDDAVTPGFVDPDTNNLRITTASPLLGIGLASASCRDDYDGSTRASGATPGAHAPQLTVPTLSSATPAEEGLELAFTDPNTEPNNESGVEVHVSTDGADEGFDLEATTSANAIAHSLSGLAEVEHWVKIRAVDSTGRMAYSDFSSVLSGTPLPEGSGGATGRVFRVTAVSAHTLLDPAQEHLIEASLQLMDKGPT